MTGRGAAGAAVPALAAALLAVVLGHDPSAARDRGPAGGRPTAAGTSGAASRDGSLPLDPALLDSLDKIRGQLEKLRGLGFRAEVPTAALSRDGVRAFVREELRKEYPPEEMAAEEETLRYLGLLGRNQSVEPILLDLLESQVAGLYDPERKVLYVVPGPVLGKAALAHELAHALADQHFDLEALEKAAREDDDRAVAAACLIEGEASAVMALWMVQAGLDPNSDAPLGGEPGEGLAAAQAGLAEAPAFLRESLLFPYLGGVRWATDVMRKGGGLKALDEYFRAPPASSEQILHPEKSVAPRDVPSRVDDALLAGAVPAGARRTKLDTMGEFGIRLLLGEPGDEQAGKAAAGWDADRYLLASHEGASFLTWVSVWDSEEDAAEFSEAAAGWLARRASATGAGAGAFAAARKGSVVVVAEGAPGGGPSSAERAASIAARLPEGIEER